jgi:hypothetical protein
VIERRGNVGVCLALFLLCAGAFADEGNTLLPVIPPAAKGDACVEPTEVIRRQHMEFLMHQRDDTVHDGIRGAKHSLVGCIDCHAQADARGVAIPINAEGQFCESCHSFAGVSMDCFGCHATVPPSDEARSALPAWMSSPRVVMLGAQGSESDP